MKYTKMPSLTNKTHRRLIEHVHKFTQILHLAFANSCESDITLFIYFGIITIDLVPKYQYC